MIPPLDPATGNLPPGIHDASWAEIAERLGTTARRRILLARFRAATETLEAAGCRLVYLDGSFVTAKELPGDFDACWDSTGVDFALLTPELFDLRSGHWQQKQRYGGELIPFTPTLDTDELL